MNLAKAQQQRETLQEIIDSLEVTLYRVCKEVRITNGKNVHIYKSVGQNKGYNQEYYKCRKVKEVIQPLDSDVCDALEDEDFTQAIHTPPAFPEETIEYYYFKDKKIAQGYAEGLYDIVDGYVSATQLYLDDKGIHMLGKHFKEENRRVYYIEGEEE